MREEKTQIIQFDNVDSSVQAFEVGDYRTALEVFRPKALKGDAKSQYYLGLMYAGGKGVIKSISQAREWIKKAADQGYGQAILEYDRLKESSSTVTWKTKKNQQNLENDLKEDLNGVQTKKIKLGDDSFVEKVQIEKKPFLWSLDLAYLYEKKTCEKTPQSKENLEKKVVWVSSKNSLNSKFSSLKKLAESGDIIAQYHVGMMYIYADDIERDLSVGVKWLERAASNNYTLAVVNLANLYFWGYGVEKSDILGFEYLKKGAELGNTDAQFMLSQKLLDKESRYYDCDEGLRWIKVAAGQGHLNSLKALGDIFNKGLYNTVQNPNKAKYYYEEAVKGG